MYVDPKVFDTADTSSSSGGSGSEGGSASEASQEEEEEEDEADSNGKVRQESASLADMGCPIVCFSSKARGGSPGPWWGVWCV